MKHAAWIARPLAAASVVCGTYGVSAFAQQDGGPASAVVVTASRLEQGVGETIAHTTVIGEKEIRDSGAADLPALLRARAGVEIVQSGGIGSQSSMFMRGSNSNDTLVLIDGVRVESVASGASAIEHIMLDDVERIEIVRGNVSALYGSNAVGGVVQVFTRSGRGVPGATVEATTGARGTRRLAASLGGAAGETRYGLALSAYRTDGFSAIDTRLAPGANPDRDGYRNASIAGNLAHRFSAGNEIGVRLYRSRGRADYDNAFGATPQETNRTDSTVQAASLYLDHRPVDAWRSRLSLGEGDSISHDVTDGQPTPFVGNRFDTHNRQIGWQNDFTLARDQVLTVGAEQLRQELATDLAFAGTSRTVDSLSLGYNGRFGAHQLQAGARHDRYSDFGAAATGLAGYAYALTESWKLTAMVSTAFRAPSFNDLYYPGFSNPALQPERSRSAEAGMQYAQRDTLVRMVLFRTAYRDLVVFDPATFIPYNVGHARVKGAEFSASQAFGAWRLRASLTAQDPVNDDTGATLLRRAKAHASGEIAREAGNWRIAAELAASGARHDGDIATFSPVLLPGYSVLNLSARYRIDRTLELTARAENALAEHYQFAHGYNTPPRGVFLGLRWQPAK